MGDISTNQEQLQALADNPDEGPFVMLNLLKFKERGGREAYLRYVQEANPFVAGVGAKVIYSGKANELVGGDQTWDAVMLVEYPSRRAFLQMASDPDYRKAHEHRLQALERAVLYATDPMPMRTILSG